MDLPVQLQENVVLNASIESLKSIRLSSRELKLLADREIQRRYRKIHRPDEFYNAPCTSTVTMGEMINYLARLESEVVTPAIAAGPNGSPEQREFLSSEIRYVLDYARLRYLLERGADPNYDENQISLIMDYNMAIDSRSRVNPDVIQERIRMVVLALKHGMIIPEGLEAREAIAHVHELFTPGRPLPAWVPANPDNWPMFTGVPDFF